MIFLWPSGQWGEWVLFFHLPVGQGQLWHPKLKHLKFLVQPCLGNAGEINETFKSRCSVQGCKLSVFQTCNFLRAFHIRFSGPLLLFKTQGNNNQKKERVKSGFHCFVFQAILNPAELWNSLRCGTECSAPQCGAWYQQRRCGPHRGRSEAGCGSAAIGPWAKPHERLGVLPVNF